MSAPKMCTGCSGTGLYSGLGKRSGHAVVCWHCKGRGGESGFRRIHPSNVREATGWGVERINAIRTVEISVEEFQRLYK